MRDDHLLWAGEAPLAADLPLAATIARLLQPANLPRWPRPRTVVAIGPAGAQVKHLEGLPPIANAQSLTRIVEENAGRFFLRNGIPLATTPVALTAPGEGWACAFEAPIVREVAEACQRLKLRLVGISPAVATITASIRSPRIVWHDGDLAAEVTHRDGALEQVRRVPIGSEAGAATPEVAVALAELGDEAWRFADAYGAAVARVGSPLMLEVHGIMARETRGNPRWRLAVAGAAAAIGAIAAATAPLLAARIESASARRSIAELAERRAIAMRSESDLRRVTAALNEVAAFDRQRRSVLALLSDLTARLPETSQLVAYRVDSAGGNVVALAARATDVVSALEETPGVVSPEIVGPVTRESIAGREKERVTVRFRWAPRGESP
ncbi:MAG TPA: hypothetical protein VHM30_17900 [Gemmatimonadaceae bacterium]|nr:hypothetical protein [Gemmatimonadaceae bacterium]